jgi:hypothetical protein
VADRLRCQAASNHGLTSRSLNVPASKVAAKTAPALNHLVITKEAILPHLQR